VHKRIQGLTTMPQITECNYTSHST